MKTPYLQCFVAVCVLLVPSWSAAAIYKCQDPDGSITYSQTPCAKNEETAKILSVSDRNGARDVQCGIVKNFAAEVGLAVEAGIDIQQLASRYAAGGELPPLTVRIMRSVYEYQSRPYKTVEDSIQHEAEVCRSERYGEPKCTDFPIAFVTEYGGCATAGDSLTRRRKLAEQRSGNKRASDNAVVQQRVAAASRAAHRRNDARQEREACLARIDKKIRKNADDAREASSPSVQDKLRRKRRSLMAQRSDC